MEISSVSIWIEKDTDIECRPYIFFDLATFSLNFRNKENTNPAITFNFKDLSKVVKFKEAVAIACDEIISKACGYDEESENELPYLKEALERR